MWKNTVEPDRSQTTILRMRVTCWIPKATNTHSEYVILIAFSTATMIARTGRSVKLYVHCLSYLSAISRPAVEAAESSIHEYCRPLLRGLNSPRVNVNATDYSSNKWSYTSTALYSSLTRRLYERIGITSR